MRRSSRLLLLALLASTAVLRILYVQRAYVVPDEFEHLHGAFLVASGATPYADFFEHHPPLFYYVAALLLPFHNPSFATIIEARYVALALSALSASIAWLWVRRSFGRTEATVTAALLFADFFLFERASLTYLDVYAAPLLLLCAFCLAGSRGQPLRCFASAVALGLAVLFTQKAITAVFAPVILFAAWGIESWRGREQRLAWSKDLAAYAIGGVAPAVLLPLLLGWGGLDSFFRDTIALNLAWKARHFPRRELIVLAVSGGAVYLLAVVGVARQVAAVYRRRFRIAEKDLPMLFLAALGSGVFLLPVVWEEYFVLLVPFAIIVAATSMVRLWREATETAGAGAGESGQRYAAFAAFVGCGAVLLLSFAIRAIEPARPLSQFAIAAVVVLWSALLIVAQRSRRADPPQLATALLAALLVFPLVQQADWVRHQSNAEQRDRLAYVLAHSQPGDTVLDGYSGYGVFRPHAYAYWFLHEEVQMMLSEDQKDARIIEALERKKPRIVIVDDYLRALPQPVLAYVAKHYEDTPYAQIKQRRDHESTAVSSAAPAPAS